MIQMPVSTRCTVLTWDATRVARAPEDQPKEDPGQVSLDQLEDEVLACQMRRPPVLKNRYWRLVRDQL